MPWTALPPNILTLFACANQRLFSSVFLSQQISISQIETIQRTSRLNDQFQLETFSVFLLFIDQNHFQCTARE
jgi:hypothetical protein